MEVGGSLRQYVIKEEPRRVGLQGPSADPVSGVTLKPVSCLQGLNQGLAVNHYQYFDLDILNLATSLVKEDSSKKKITLSIGDNIKNLLKY